ncbi:hypothetical protein N8Z27_02270 [Crocinitomicaceae bacterium]|nr:hypothetical protein [Crocinitomicaceae bacterium]MDC1282987.1 hypothetical protein [Crocinitomicaceae bacterium]
MKIFLTYDYELFFGEDSGSVEKCMLEPTEDLFNLAKWKEVFLTFFVDVGYLIQAEKYPELQGELQSVKEQVQQMITLGHDVQLHIHPHWEKAAYEKGKWSMNVDGVYKLSDFEQSESDKIVRSYKSYLEKLIGRSVTTFRAGGWCIQPFEHVAGVFKEVGIKIDSSVITGDFIATNEYAVDFREAPSDSKYTFANDVCVKDDGGDFTEYPITSLRYSPLFFWRLYILGRLKPAQHKMIGDGDFISQGRRKKRVLRTFTIGHVSSDGYYASKLESGLEKSTNMEHKEMVVIGHPKGNTKFSIKSLAKFINKNHMKHQFTTFQKES